jgi:hypothetical protein
MGWSRVGVVGGWGWGGGESLGGIRVDSLGAPIVLGAFLSVNLDDRVLTVETFSDSAQLISKVTCFSFTHFFFIHIS